MRLAIALLIFCSSFPATCKREEKENTPAASSSDSKRNALISSFIKKKLSRDMFSNAVFVGANAAELQFRRDAEWTEMLNLLIDQEAFRSRTGLSNVLSMTQGLSGAGKYSTGYSAGEAYTVRTDTYLYSAYFRCESQCYFVGFEVTYAGKGVP